MKITFPSKEYEQLLIEAKHLNVSIPSLIIQIIKEHYKQEPHKGVNINNERESKIF